MSDRIIHYKSMEDYIMDNELLYSKNKYRNIYIENELYCNLKILYKDEYFDVIVEKQVVPILMKQVLYIQKRENANNKFYYVTTARPYIRIEKLMFKSSDIDINTIKTTTYFNNKNTLDFRINNIKLLKTTDTYYLYTNDSKISDYTNSGYVGIKYREHNGTKAWITEWFSGHAKHCKCFRINEYGNKLAKEKALEYRKIKLKELRKEILDTKCLKIELNDSLD